MREQEPTVRSRELGDGLRAVMRQAGLNGQQTAQLLDLSPGWVSRLLSGKRGCTELDVAAFLGVCRVKGAERGRLLALCQEQHIPGWFQQHGSRLPKQLRTLIDHENKATAIGVFEATFRLMEFAEFKPVAYLESETSSLFLERPEEITAYRRILESLADTALNEEQSRELIATLATEFAADREDPS